MKAEITSTHHPQKSNNNMILVRVFATSPKLPNSLYHDIIKTFSKNKTKKIS